jgi:hypothetical protein
MAEPRQLRVQIGNRFDATPAAIFARVDLPAPFAPIKATTSPRRTEI